MQKRVFPVARGYMAVRRDFVISYVQPHFVNDDAAPVRSAVDAPVYGELSGAPRDATLTHLLSLLHTRSFGTKIVLRAGSVDYCWRQAFRGSVWYRKRAACIPQRQGR